MEPSEILKFWFKDSTSTQWFNVDPQFDEMIARRFSKVLDAAKECELYTWRTTVEGRLAEIIVLDQFSRNIYRAKAESFSQDKVALILAQEMVQLKLDAEIPITQRAFIYLPYMHSESLFIHHEAMRLFSQKGLEENARFEKLHQEILERFGRYPHRNLLLGRSSTEEETEFLKSPNSSF